MDAKSAASVLTYETFSGAGKAGYKFTTSESGYRHEQRVTIQAVDGEIECGVEIHHLTKNGVLLSEYRLLGRPQSIRPIVIATLEAILKANER